jgi:hypothetical protein
MKPIDRHSLEEQTRLVSRYVAGDLSRSERAEFETWLVASPELAAEVEMERRLRRGMLSAARRGWLQRDHPPRQFRPSRRHMAFAASAAVALMVGLGLLLSRLHGGQQRSTVAMRDAAAQPLATTRTIRLDALRGIAGSPSVLLTSDQMPAQLVIEPDVVVLTCEDGSLELECAGGAAPLTPQYQEYELELVHRRTATLTWRSPARVPNHRGQLSFILHDPARFAAGDYDLVVRGRSRDHAEVVARFWLQVRP